MKVIPILVFDTDKGDTIEEGWDKDLVVTHLDPSDGKECVERFKLRQVYTTYKDALDEFSYQRAKKIGRLQIQIEKLNKLGCGYVE